MKKKFVTSLALAVMGTAMMAGSAMATPLGTAQMRLIYDGNTYTVIDNDLTPGKDRSSEPGYLDVQWNISGLLIEVAVGSTKPIYGDAYIPSLHLTLNTTTRPGHISTKPITVSFSDIDYGPIASSIAGFESMISANGYGTYNLGVYYDTSNTLWGSGTQIASIGNVYKETEGYHYNGTPTGNPFSMTIVSTLYQSASKTSSADIDVIPNPEPATMLLFGTGLVGLAGVVRRRLAKKA